MKKSEMEEKILGNLANGLNYRGGKGLAIGSAVGLIMAAIFCDIMERKCVKDGNNLSAKYVNGEYEPDNEE